MGADIILIQVMTIIGRNHRNGQPPAHIAQGLIDMILNIDPVVLNLQKKISLTKQAEIKPGGLIRRVLPAIIDKPWNFAMKTGGKRNEPLGVILQYILVNPGFVVKPLKLGYGRQFAEIPVAFHVFGQQNDMRKSFVVLGCSFGNGTRRNIAFTADNRLDAGFNGFFIKLDGPEHGSMIGNGNAVHAVGFHPLQERLYSNGAIQKTVLGVNVKVNEICHYILEKLAIGKGLWAKN
jgi:hypothetical protein